MNGLQRHPLRGQNSFTFIIVSSLLMLTTLLFFFPCQEIALSQTGDVTSLFINPDNMTTAGSSTFNPSAGSSQSLSGFIANGKINSVIEVPNGKWLATGNLSMIVNNGN